jgi:hypothetical protein
VLLREFHPLAEKQSDLGRHVLTMGELTRRIHGDHLFEANGRSVKLRLA